MRVRIAAGGAILMLVTAGCAGNGSAGKGGSGAPQPVTTLSPSQVADLWPAPADPLSRSTAAGLQAEVKEHLAFHVHAHLDVFVDGNPITVPAGIGINITDRGVKKFTDTPDGAAAYGGIKGCRTPCISPLHTHDNTGILHTEAATPQPNTLGQFFTEWGVPLSESCVGDFCRPTPIAVYVNGKPNTQDPTAIQLTFQKEIAIVIGQPPDRIPDTADFSQA